jgi:DNA-binding NtrC family response regulator
MTMARLLVVEDEAVLAKNIQRSLEKVGHSVTLAASGAEGERLFADLRPDVTLLDLRLPDANGLDILPRLMAEDAEARVLIMTAYASVEDAVHAIKLGAKDYVEKPLNLEDLRRTVARVLEERQLQNEVAYYRHREASGTGLEAIVGACPTIVELRGRIERLTSLPPTAAPPTVLITGETGTGKGLVARVLHYNGHRADRPFIEVNCAAIPENLVEAELFGYQRGAFTDAKTSKVGLFQAAHRGTLFLDEIGCLPLMVQVKILKAIEEKTVRSVGGRNEDHVDIQIVAATNGDLDAAVKAGTFREDLFYRLRVAPLVVPPLRDRGDDLLLLTRMFLEELASRYRMAPKKLSAAGEAAIRGYRWPGNVRELRNTLDRAVLFSETSEICPASLSLPTVKGVAVAVAPDRGEGFEVTIPDGGVRLEDVERALIVSGLRKAGGSQTEAARLLGISRDTLRYRMEKFGITSKV